MYGNSQNTIAPASQNQPRPPQPYFVQHDRGGSTELSTTLVHALSDVTGADVTQVEAGISGIVDPTALDRLFEAAQTDGPRPNGHVTFAIWDHQVTVYHNGQIAITPPGRSRFA